MYKIKKNSHNDLTTNFTTGTTSIGILYQLQWLLMKENYSKKKIRLEGKQQL